VADLTFKPALERVLSTPFGDSIRVISCEPLPSRGIGGRYVETHPHLWRCGLTSTRVDVPETIVVKTRATDAPYDPALLHNERAALDFLAGAAAPRPFGADEVHRFIAMEDLGAGPSVDLFLVGDDSDAATNALLSFARELGRLHAATTGRAEEYYRIRRALGPVDPGLDRTSVLRSRLAESWRLLAGVARSRSWLPDPLGVDDDVDHMLRSLAEPGPYLAFTNGDMCPQNTRLFEGRVRFLDFENAAFRHAAVDIAMLRFPFAACPCWSPLPPDVTTQLEDAYRAEFAAACPQVADDAEFMRAMAVGCAAWAILRSVRIPRLEALDAPQPMGFSRRGQLLATIRTFTDSAAKARILGRLAHWFAELAGALRVRWPEVRDRERVYPAYADTAAGL
jgi:hypothetical protein